MKICHVQRGVILAVFALGLTAGCTRAESPESTDAVATPMVDDARLVTHVEARYQAAPAIRETDIDVTASGGVVTLRGAVDTDDARRQAEAVAREVEGVTTVENELRVATQGAEPAAARATEGAATATPDAAPAGADSEARLPSWITTKIQAQYFLNAEVKPWNVDVTTRRDGTVTLRGEVDEAADRDEAVRIARATEGVTTVKNELRVKGEPAPASMPDDVGGVDPWTTAKIQAKYFGDSDVKGRRIDVTTKDGVVTLTGEVGSEAERRQAVALARMTDGVSKVTDQLSVQPAAATEPVSAAPGDRAVATQVEDGWITTKLQAQYFLDDTIKGRDINVDTRRGVVTLAGSVTSQAEKDLAETIARDTEGVSRVLNQLAVTTKPQ